MRVSVLLLVSGLALSLVSGGAAAAVRSPRRHATAALPAAAAQVPNCQFDGMDFSSLSGVAFVDKSVSWQPFALSVCAPLSEAASPECAKLSNQSAAACALRTELQAPFVMGEWDAADAPAFSYINASNPDAGVQYSMWGQGNQCLDGSNNRQETVVQLVCAPEQSALMVASSNTEGAPCSRVFTLQTPLACKGPVPPVFECAYKSVQGDSFDFSRLTSQYGESAPGNLNYEIFSVNVCGSLPNDDVACRHAALCGGLNYKTAALPGAWATLASSESMPSPAFSLLTPGDAQNDAVVQLTYTNAQSSGNAVTTQFNFICNRNNDTTAYSVNHIEHYRYVVTVLSPLSCPITSLPQIAVA